MEDLELPELTSEQVEQVCVIAENAARKHILSRIPSKKVEALNISAEADGVKPLKLTVDVDLVMPTTVQNMDVKQLTDEAVKQAFASAEKYLRGIACHSQK